MTTLKTTGSRLLSAFFICFGFCAPARAWDWSKPFIYEMRIAFETDNWINMYSTATVLSKSDNTVAFRVVANSTTTGAVYQLVVTTQGNVGIGTASPAAVLDISGTEAVKIPIGTTAQRPANPANGMIRLNTTTGKLEYYNGGWSTVGQTVAAGGTVTDINGYRIHTFTASGTFTVTSGGTVEVLVVGGGGGGGAGYGGGGGAGGYVYNASFPVTAQEYSVIVGTGGGGTVISPVTAATNGGNSVFSTITALGGGRASYYPYAAADGGSGGGESADLVGSGGSASDATQGHHGGTGYGSPSSGGGGGGAGAVGGNATSSGGGNGGAGTANSISGVSVTYAGGGGGGTYQGTAGSGGAGGGGNANYDAAGSNGTANTGGGGGDGSRNHSTAVFYNGGSGGSGIVIIRYPH